MWGGNSLLIFSTDILSYLGAWLLFGGKKVTRGGVRNQLDLYYKADESTSSICSLFLLLNVGLEGGWVIAKFVFGHVKMQN